MTHLSSRIWPAFLIVFFHLTASAHSLKIFAAREGSSIEGSVYFSGGGAPGNLPVHLLDSTGILISTSPTNPDGEFIFPNTPSASVLLVVETPDGHCADFLLGETTKAETREPAPEQENLPFIIRLAIGWTVIAILGLLAFGMPGTRKMRP